MNIPPRSAALARCIISNNLKVMVEIGTAEGENAYAILNQVNDPDFMLICIDPYLEYPEFMCEKYDENSLAPRIKENRDHAYATIFKDSRCTHIEKFSRDAVVDFRDGIVDIIFIDGNHFYEYVLDDITLWYPKIKKGGFMVGHDYTKKQFGVYQAVQEFVRMNPSINVSTGAQDCWHFRK